MSPSGRKHRGKICQNSAAVCRLDLGLFKEGEHAKAGHATLSARRPPPSSAAVTPVTTTRDINDGCKKGRKDSGADCVGEPAAGHVGFENRHIETSVLRAREPADDAKDAVRVAINILKGYLLPANLFS